MEFAGREIGKGINHDICYDPATGQPNLGAINDPRMGSNTSDPEHPGYCGHIELVRPVYHIGFLKIVIDILRSVSYYTSELLVSREDYAEKKGRRNLKEITRSSKTIKKCPITQKKLPTYTKEGTKIAVDHGKGKEIISPVEVYSILEKISDEDAQIMGLNTKYTRPEWLLLTTLCVPPPHVRPSVFMSSSQKCDDDLTTKLNEIVKTNIALTNAIEKSNQDQGSTNEHYISQLESLLQYNVSTFMDNQHPGQPPSLQRSGKPLKTLRERLSGKDGRVRGNLMGKRVDFSARTVITADPNLSLDQVGVPKTVAMNLTVPEMVTDYNKDKLLELVKRGPNVHPGAKFVIKTGGSKLDLKFAKIVDLKNGWVVERHLQDGDEIIFNRQPSLHKMSMMGHKTKVLEGATFRLNLAYTGAYNADFDGDEMNLHVPQSLTARAEIDNLMMVDRLIINPQSNKPVIGIIQDSLLSSCKMTRRNVFIKKDRLMNMIMLIDGWDHNIPKPAIVKSKGGKLVEYWTGKQVFSLILPKSLILDNVRNPMNPEDKGIMIRAGKIISGSVDKAVIGKSQGGLIHIIFNDFGSGTTKVFLNQVQKLSNYWIKQHGFTIGVGDAVASLETTKQVNDILETTKTKVKDIIKNESGADKDPRMIEELINAELNAAVSEAGKKAEESLNFNNNFKATVSAGSKGSSINISQIMAVVGQQNVEGHRINFGFKDRTLPHYQKKDVGQESRGFVENNYLKGLTPQEFFFHGMAGREGIIDTACKSLVSESLVIISMDSETKVLKIGEWIDEYMGLYPSDIVHNPSQKNTEILKIDDKCQCLMPTTDNYGNTSWEKVTHLVRHDPGELVYEVKTRGGRSVKVIESKSLLVFDPKTETFNSKLTSEIIIGEFVPVNMSLEKPSVIHQSVPMERYLPKVNFPDKFVLDYNNGIFIGLFLAEGHARIKEKSENTSAYTEIANNDPHIRNFVKAWFKNLDIECVETSSTVKGYSLVLATFLHKFLGHMSHGKYVPDEAFSAPDDFVIGLLNGYYSGDGCVHENGVMVSSVSERMIHGISLLLNRFGIYGNIQRCNILPKFTLNVRGQWSRIFAERIPLILKYKQDKLNDIIRLHNVTKHINYNDTQICQNDVVLDEIVSIQPLDPKDYPKVYDVTIPQTLNFMLFNGVHIADTAEVGYIQRRLVKALEDVSVKYDNTVRNSRGLIIQFLYGEDGIDATYMENIHLKLLGYNSADLEKNYLNRDLPEEFELIKRMQFDLVEIARRKELNNAKLDDDYYPMPVNVSRIVKFAKSVKTDSQERFTASEIHREVQNLCSRISNIFIPSKDAIEGSEKIRSSNATKLFRIYVASELATIRVKDLNRQQLLYVVQDIEIKFKKALVSAGEMCGILAAQSIGELTTQLTLNSVDYDTTLVIDWTGDSIPPVRPNEKVGKFIDALIEKFPERCQLQQDGHTIWLPLPEGTAKALSVDEDGNMMWTELEAVTKHLPVNKDGTKTLLKVTTSSGREAICTKGKSFLVHENGKIVAKEGYDLQIGDLIPVVNKIDAQSFRSNIDVKTILSPREYVFTDYMVYPKGWAVGDGAVNGMPDTIELSREFGFLVGAYLAEEFSTRFLVGISNNDENYRKMATAWTDRLGISNSTIVRDFITEICGIGSYRKRVPEFVFSGPDCFAEGLLDGYICGDGSVHKNGSVTSSSRSKELRDGISLLLARFNIHSTLSTGMVLNKRQPKPNYYMYCSVYECHKFQSIITAIDYKVKRINQNCDRDDARKLNLFKDTLLDQVTSIEEIVPDHEFVYDLTVHKTRNMTGVNGLLLNDTFHSTGISAKNITLGVPRLKELINITKKLKAPSLTMYEKDSIKDLNPVGQKRIIEGIRSSLEYKTLQDIIKSSDIIYSDDEEYSDDFDVVNIYKELYEYTDSPFPENFLSLRFQFSSKELECVDTSLLEISKLLERSVKNGHKIICSDDNSVVNGKENIFIRIICADAGDDNEKDQMVELRKTEVSCMSIKIKGCENISRVYTREAKVNKWTPDKGHFKELQWVLETEGTNLVDSMEVQSIDQTKTVSNNVIEIYEVFGIEAARQSLLNELRTVLSFDGSYVNYRHLAILVDTMTCRGTLTAMTRHGINRVDAGTLTKCSFEETVEVLTDAAAFGEIDTLKGISDNIMLGQTIPSGTGAMDIIYDTEMEPDTKVPAISREPTPFVMDTYVPSEPDYGPLSAWNY